MKNSFGKQEKLKSRKKIAEIFADGISISSFPLRLKYISQESGLPHQAAFSVPKRSFPKAVSRNRLKRQMKEAYRIHKNLVKSNNDGAFALVFLYISKDKESYAVIEKAMRELLQKLQ